MPSSGAAARAAPARRLTPWILLGLLTLAAVAAASIGQVHSPSAESSPPTGAPDQWVAALLATTKASGTAHVTYTERTESPNPALRGLSTAHGVIDFRNGDTRTTSVSTSVEYSSTDGGPQKRSVVRDVDETIDIGKASWQRFGGSWTKLPRTSGADDPLDLEDFGGLLPVDARGDGAQVAGVQDLGPAAVGGVATTRYLVTASAPKSCAAAARAATAAGDFVGPTTLWVDGAGRLVQARTEVHVDLTFSRSMQQQLAKLQAKSQEKIEKEHPGTPVPPSLPALALPTGAQVIVSTSHFADFGAPVRITAPSTTPQPGITGAHSFKLLQVGGSAVGIGRSARHCSGS